MRDAIESDYGKIRSIHARMGMDYELPDLKSPLFIVRKAVDLPDGDIAACFLRLTAETYLWIPPEAKPRAKMDAMNALQPEVLNAAWMQGIDETEARIPTDVERRFRKRLTQLGWTRDRDEWWPWSRKCVAR